MNLTAKEFIHLLKEKNGNLTSEKGIRVIEDVEIPLNLVEEMRLGRISFYGSVKLGPKKETVDQILKVVHLGNAVILEDFSCRNAELEQFYCGRARFCSDFEGGNMKAEKFFCMRALFLSGFSAGTMTIRKGFYADFATFKHFRLNKMHTAHLSLGSSTIDHLDMGGLWTDKLSVQDCLCHVITYPKGGKMDYTGDRIKGVPFIKNIRDLISDESVSEGLLEGKKKYFPLIPLLKKGYKPKRLS